MGEFLSQGVIAVRHYYLYLIEDDIAENYFGEESKLFYLFLEAQQSHSPTQSRTLNRQIHYITKTISIVKFESQFKHAFGSRKDYHSSSAYHSLTSQGASSHAELKLNESYLTLRATGSFEAETDFFEVLRQSERCFLAMDFDRLKFGWLKPVKQTSFVH